MKSPTRRAQATTAITTALLLFSSPLLAESIVIPADTAVFAELAERITSHKRDTATGDIVPARVWRDVEVDGQVVIEEGAELVLRVGHVKKARFLGRKGHLVLEAVAVQAADGTTVALDGSQYRSGKGRKAVTGTLAIAVAWPFLFLRGKNARAEAGTVLEARVDRNVSVEVGFASEEASRSARP